MKIDYHTAYSQDKRRWTVTPARYTAHRNGDKIIAHITLHPILRKYPDLRRGVLGHEMDEVAAWARGNTAAHHFANNREPEVTKELGGIKGFWKEVQRREAGKSKS